MNANKHLLLWSSLATLALLLWMAFDENYLRQWRTLQRQYAGRRAAAGKSFEVKLRQLVVPELKAFDRCVSCHVGMAPGEPGIPGHKVLGPHPRIQHDPKALGCVICHGGQGRATRRADAHGTAPHWPEPMIPVRHAQAGCGACHTHLAVPRQAQMSEGLKLIERHDCLACHRLDGRGGTTRPGRSDRVIGPDLTGVGGSGRVTGWYPRHTRRLASAGGPEAAAWRASFGPLPPRERTAISGYLATRVGAPGLVRGKALFHTLGCRGCHKVHQAGGDDGPDLSNFGLRDPARLPMSRIEGPHTLDNWIAQHLRDPRRVVPESRMPALGLDRDQIESLTLYLLSLRLGRVPEALWPRDRARGMILDEREFATDGASLYGVYCAACHGDRGQGRRFAGMGHFPAVGRPGFLSIASDAVLEATIRKGRPGRRMPAWGEQSGGLRDAEIRALVAHLRRLGGGVAPPPDPHPRRWVKGRRDRGGAIYARACAGCHGSRGQGGEGTALKNSRFLAAVSDTFLVRSVSRGRPGTSMPAFSAGSPAHRSLSAGEIEAVVSFIRGWEDNRK
jgi:mono/diheme cytochrome c family protein